MALLDSELLRVKAELGLSAVGLNADPWIGYTSLFDSVIQPYLTTGATTTSSTAVTAASEPTPVSLILGDASGFSTFDRIVVDVDSRQEIATVQSIAGSTVTVLLRKAHSGTYPVTVEAGESQVRHYLHQLTLIADALSGSGNAATSAGIKKVDEIEFFPGGATQSQLRDLRQYWRAELAKLLGIYEWWSTRQSGGAHGGNAITIY